MQYFNPRYCIIPYSSALLRSPKYGTLYTTRLYNYTTRLVQVLTTCVGIYRYYKSRPGALAGALTRCEGVVSPLVFALPSCDRWRRQPYHHLCLVRAPFQRTSTLRLATTGAPTIPRQTVHDANARHAQPVVHSTRHCHQHSRLHQVPHPTLLPFQAHWRLLQLV